MDNEQKHILLVEDELGHAELIKRSFQRETGYHLTVTDSIQLARQLIEKETPDLMITDFLLPDGKGIELLPTGNEEIKFPVILMTSHGNEQVAVEAMKSGALDYIVKSDLTLMDMPHIVRRVLREWNYILEKRIADERIRKSLYEKEILLKEIHHRVKNNLQVISSLLRLQSNQVSDEQALKMFRESQNRVQSMALVHEKLYRSNNFSEIDFSDYVKSLAKSLYRAYDINPSKVVLNIIVEPTPIGIDIAVPCGLVINELVSNALKYAFPAGWESDAEIRIELGISDKNEIQLVVTDNGMGLPDDFSFETTRSLGVHLIKILIEDQLKGSIKLDRKQGTHYQIRFNPMIPNSREKIPE